MTRSKQFLKTSMQNTANDQYRLIAAFLSQYLTANDGGLEIPPIESYLRAGLCMLVRDGVMTVEEIRQEALADYNVIIPWFLFKEEYT